MQDTKKSGWRILSGTVIGKTIYVVMLHGSKDVQPMEVWHKRLGYINQEVLKNLRSMSTGMEFGPAREQTLNEDCNPCLKAAQHVTISRIPLRRHLHLGYKSSTSKSPNACYEHSGFATPWTPGDEPREIPCISNTPNNPIVLD